MADSLKETLIKQGAYATCEMLKDLGNKKKGKSYPIPQSTAEALKAGGYLKITKAAVDKAPKDTLVKKGA